MKKNYFILVLFLILLSCNNSDNSPCDNYKWSFHGDTGPDTWSICYSQCDGKMQSPIDISNPIEDEKLNAIDFNYSPSQILLENTGNYLVFNYMEGSYILLDSIQYDLVQFHTHMKSDHTVDSKSFPMEIHLVHQNEETEELAVVALFVEVGEPNPVLETFINDLPKSEGGTFHSETEINAIDLLPESPNYYFYNGSLTSPPCTEGVLWNVMLETIQASQDQMDKYYEILKNNERPVQPINGRKVYLYKERQSLAQR
ncbi:carbonic anhydrase [Aureibacter tunicatorum]|uniref:carbonic anhydrase n=1 Tax=Aureibacter tunicatorum TaxID=866807 RepID=A0AAE3XRV3_9BACT|nr:carbonic anhydrase family protein [Aureibacter tunicatorum]MDR6241997.1 carbonic anhydrase [Aureibacter tunicatorum]BDD07270.1 carbonic anhydrase [Aureibacter tunicatorum]